MSASIWNGKSIVLGVTGGVAIYKAVDMASKLTQQGAEVDVVMTDGAMEFVKPLLFAAVTRREVFHNQWEAVRSPEHIALAQRPDIVVVAPATANTIAKMAHGIADNLLTSVLVATRKPVLVAPAMNTGMWESPSVGDNMAVLRKRNIAIVGPESGYLACGDVGSGRMSAPAAIIAAMESLLQAAS